MSGEAKRMSDAIDRAIQSTAAQQAAPDHYAAMPIQPWDALAAWLTPEQFRGYLLGEAMVYLARYNAQAPGKGGVADLRKARHSLDRLLVEIERETKR
jgi:hypothetical protein